MTERAKPEKLPRGAKLFIAACIAVAVLSTVSIFTLIYMNFVSNENFKLANHCHNVRKHKPDYDYDRDCPQYKGVGRWFVVREM